MEPCGGGGWHGRCGGGDDERPVADLRSKSMDIALWNTLIAVGSALLGVVIGGVLTIWNDTLKWRREQQVRYNADRLKAYTDFLQTVDHAAFTWGPFWIKGGTFTVNAPPELMADFTAANNAYQKILFLAPKVCRPPRVTCTTACLPLSWKAAMPCRTFVQRRQRSARRHSRNSGSKRRANHAYADLENPAHLQGRYSSGSVKTVGTTRLNGLKSDSTTLARCTESFPIGAS